jgi:DNA-binding transcriptional ArsR family regulator
MLVKGDYHPNAFLADFRNVELGLKARTAVLTALEKGDADAKKIALDKKMMYGVVMHHLKLLESRGIVQRKGSRPAIWAVTGLGQRRL